MIYVSYKDLVMRFGQRDAGKLVTTIERLAQMHDQIITPIDHEVRLQRALEALKAVDFSVGAR